MPGRLLQPHTPLAPDAPGPRPAPLADWWALLRPRQWTKNLVVFAGLLFAGRFLEWPAVLAAAAAFGIFCLLSSAGYLLNDALDAAKDRAHPVKCRRPIAAGRVSPAAAIAVAAVLALACLGGAWRLAPYFGLTALAYLAVTLTYSLYWKHQVILDLVAIAGGFLLRMLAGTVVLGIQTSSWLFVCVFLLALLLGLGKRRHELFMLEEEANNHRPVLEEYGRPFLDQGLAMTAGAAFVTYAVYAIQSQTALAHPKLVATVPLVFYAILRYLYLVFHRDLGGSPEELFLSDRPLYLAIALWAATVVAVLLVR